MPHGVIQEIMPASSQQVFDTLHDYEHRLKWDTLLQSAQLTDGWKVAQRHAVAVCRGRWIWRFFEFKTEYVSFHAPHVAAVRLLNHPPCFETFAATIRHRDLNDQSSLIEYVLHFQARPTVLRWILHPLMNMAFRWETRRRLRALSKHLASIQPAPQQHSNRHP